MSTKSELKIQLYGSIAQKELTLLIWPMYLCSYWESSEIFERINARRINIWIILTKLYNNNDKTYSVIFIYFNLASLHTGFVQNAILETLANAVDLHLVYFLSLCA